MTAPAPTPPAPRWSSCDPARLPLLTHPSPLHPAAAAAIAVLKNEADAKRAPFLAERLLDEIQTSEAIIWELANIGINADIVIQMMNAPIDNIDSMIARNAALTQPQRPAPVRQMEPGAAHTWPGPSGDPSRTDATGPSQPRKKEDDEDSLEALSDDED